MFERITLCLLGLGWQQKSADSKGVDHSIASFKSFQNGLHVKN